ncbi:MAG: LacI family DNA-binding transcriptional regulator [Proteobacteria bacterium]|nr:LacI family DNA-binding transcriptional regulator [Pseudomonadota bacterium]
MHFFWHAEFISVNVCYRQQPASTSMNPKSSLNARSIDVARLAGVSRSAVSRAFTEGAYVSGETRAKILKAATQLGYSPNAIARGLITRRSRMVGVVVADLSNPFYARVLEATCLKLQEAGLAPLMLSCRRSQDLDSLVPQLLAYQVDGVLIAASTLSSTLASQCARAGRPVVLINRYVNLDAVNAVTCDNVGGARAMADHLVQGGHKRIAFLAGLEDTSSSRDRERGFVGRLGELKVALFARESGNYTYADACSAVRRLLGRRLRPDALFCANDTMAIAAIDIARHEFGLEVPADLSVAGYDNIEAASWKGYDLTSVDQDVDRMTDAAVGLLQNGDKGGKPRHILVPARLEKRGSTRDVRAGAMRRA